MTQLGIEPMTTRLLVVALTTKLLGPQATAAGSRPPHIHMHMHHIPFTDPLHPSHHRATLPLRCRWHHPGCHMQSGTFFGFIPFRLEWEMVYFFDARGQLIKFARQCDIFFLFFLGGVFLCFFSLFFCRALARKKCFFGAGMSKTGNSRSGHV